MKKGENIYTTKDGQSIYDICLQEFGTLDYLKTFMQDNNLDFNSKLQGGMNLIVNNEGEGDQTIKDEISNKNITLATQGDPRRKAGLFDGDHDYIFLDSDPDVLGNRKIKFKLKVFSENFAVDTKFISLRTAASADFFAFGASLTKFYARAGSVIGNSKEYPLAGLSNRVLDIEVIKTASVISSININENVSTTVGTVGTDAAFSDRYFGKYASVFANMVLWDIEISTFGGISEITNKWKGNGITDRNWRDTVSGNDGEIIGELDLYYL